jgi:hypothetical protein
MGTPLAVVWRGRDPQFALRNIRSESRGKTINQDDESINFSMDLRTASLKYLTAKFVSSEM